MNILKLYIASALITLAVPVYGQKSCISYDRKSRIKNNKDHSYMVSSKDIEYYSRDSTGLEASTLQQSGQKSTGYVIRKGNDFYRVPVNQITKWKRSSACKKAHIRYANININGQNIPFGIREHALHSGIHDYYPSGDKSCPTEINADFHKKQLMKKKLPTVNVVKIPRKKINNEIISSRLDRALRGEVSWLSASSAADIKRLNSVLNGKAPASLSIKDKIKLLRDTLLSLEKKRSEVLEGLGSCIKTVSKTERGTFTVIDNIGGQCKREQLSLQRQSEELKKISKQALEFEKLFEVVKLCHGFQHIMNDKNIADYRAVKRFYVSNLNKIQNLQNITNSKIPEEDSFSVQ